MVGGDGEGVEELKEDGRRLIKLKKQKWSQLENGKVEEKRERQQMVEKDMEADKVKEMEKEGENNQMEDKEVEGYGGRRDVGGRQ